MKAGTKSFKMKPQEDCNKYFKLYLVIKTRCKIVPSIIVVEEEVIQSVANPA